MDFWVYRFTVYKKKKKEKKIQPNVAVVRAANCSTEKQRHTPPNK
jgi:hypothetical protein